MTVTPSLCDWGQKKYITPEKIRGETAYRGTDSTADSIAQDVTDCKQKRDKQRSNLRFFPLAISLAKKANDLFLTV